MSYDLAVFAAQGLTSDDLRELVSESKGLTVLNRADLRQGEPNTITIGRGALQEYCFTVDGPYLVELEDLPERVTASVLGAKVIYQVLVEGSSEKDVPHAIRFARKLAKSLGGVVVDEQTEELWPRKTQRDPISPDIGTKIDIVDMRWYYLIDNQPENLPEIYLRLARRYLPEALPRRFGVYEPLKGNLERDGDQAFINLCLEHPFDLVFMTGTYPIGPCLMDSACGKNFDKSNRSHRPIGYITVRIDRNILITPAWREATKNFFMELAVASRSFYANAEVLRGYIRKQQDFGMDSNSEVTERPVYLGQWIGVPAIPSWWTWTDENYSGLLAPYFLGDTQSVGHTMFHSWGDEPLDRDQIAERHPEARTPWIPNQYSPTYLDGRFTREASAIPKRLSLGPVVPR